MPKTHRSIALILALSAAAAAHATPPALSPAPPLPPAEMPLDPAADPPQTQVVPVLRDYDRFQDKTTLRVEGIRPAITRGESRLFLNATSSFDGAATAVKPAKVQIEVLAVSDQYQFAELKDEMQLILLITKDLAPAIPQAGPASSQPTNIRRVRVPAKFQKAGLTKDHTSKTLESFVAIVDADVLAQLATAPLVEGQLGSVEFKLGTMEQLSFRRFAEQVNLVPPLPAAAATALDRALTGGPVRVDAVALHLAQAKVDAASENVDRLTTACLVKLEQTKEFQTASEAAAALEAKKDQTPAGPERAAISQQWLEARAKVSLMKSSAVLEDASLTNAKRDLTDAQSAMHSLQRLAAGQDVRDARK